MSDSCTTSDGTLSPPNAHDTQTRSSGNNDLIRRRRIAAERQRRYRQNMDEETRRRYREKDAANKRLKRQEQRQHMRHHQQQRRQQQQQLSVSRKVSLPSISTMPFTPISRAISSAPADMGFAAETLAKLSASNFSSPNVGVPSTTVPQSRRDSFQVPLIKPIVLHQNQALSLPWQTSPHSQNVGVQKSNSWTFGTPTIPMSMPHVSTTPSLSPSLPVLSALPPSLPLPPMIQRPHPIYLSDRMDAPHSPLFQSSNLIQNTNYNSLRIRTLMNTAFSEFPQLSPSESPRKSAFTPIKEDQKDAESMP